MSDSLRLNAFFRFRIFCVSISKRVLVQNLSYEKEFDSQENEPQTQFHINRFRTKTRSDTEAKANSEMAYLPSCGF